MEERLQKYMARCGVDSRRKCEELIAGGLVEVNGEVVREPGVKIDPAVDVVKVDGKKLRTEKSAYYLHYKVKGVTTTVSDDLGRKTVMDCLPDIAERVYPVGRLDRESEGLLVLTNDGELANFLTHPANGVEKTYRVVAEGRIPPETLAQLAEKGMRLGPVLVKPTRVEMVRQDAQNTVVLISVAEGVNREVRRIFAALGHEVKKLLRIEVGPLSLKGMKRGQTRVMTPKELFVLRKAMAGADPEPDAMFPPGTARSRKPTGPRGRPKRVKAPRLGKPDPAAYAKPVRKKRSLDMLENEKENPRRAGRNAKPDSRPGSRTESRPGSRPGPRSESKPAKGDKPLRPLKKDKPADEKKSTSRPAKAAPPRSAPLAHPLFSKPAAAPGTKSPGRRPGRPQTKPAAGGGGSGKKGGRGPGKSGGAPKGGRKAK